MSKKHTTLYFFLRIQTNCYKANHRALVKALITYRELKTILYNITLRETALTTITIETDKLVKWSFTEKLPVLNEGVYYIRYDGGINATNLVFSITLNKSSDYKSQLSICYTTSHLYKLNFTTSPLLTSYVDTLDKHIVPNPLLCGLMAI